MFLTTITLLYRDNVSLMCKPHDRGWLWAAEAVDSLHFPSPCICVLAFCIFTHICFCIVYFQYKFIFVFVYVREPVGEQQKPWIPCSFCLLPVVNTSQGPQQAESLHPPGFWFWFYFLFHFIFSFHPPWFYIFIWSTSRIESFQTLSSFLMDAMSLEMRRT